MKQRSSTWCFTIPNYHENNFDFGIFDNMPCYWIIGYEECPTTKTPHIQGYCYFKNNITGSRLIKYIGKYHIEPAKGNFKQNFAYCSKDGCYLTSVDFGYTYKPPEQGKRNDLEHIKEMVEQKKTLEEILDEHPSTFIRYYKGIEKAISVKQKHRTTKPTVYWYWGESGSGKTRTAVSNTPDSYYIKDETQWWDGYTQQDTIIIDDYDASIPFRSFLRLLDRNRYNGQVKGSTVKINSPYIIITCDRPPQSLYRKYKPFELSQLLRRIDKIRQFKIILPDNIGWQTVVKEQLEDISVIHGEENSP